MWRKKDHPKTFTEKVKTAVRGTLLVLCLAAAAFIGIDGYFNEWSFVKSVVYHGQLELHDVSGRDWILRPSDGFEIVQVKDVRQMAVPESLIVFDEPYRSAGYYRIYFRMSDSLSAKVQKLTDAWALVDTGRSVERTIIDVRRAYGVLRRIVGRDSVSEADSGMALSRPPAASSIPRTEGSMVAGSGSEVSGALGHVFKNPQVLIGVGLGLAAAAGIELLQGDGYLVIARRDVFRINDVRLGAHAGRWEGKPIDVLWALSKPDTTHVSGLAADSTAFKPDTLDAAMAAPHPDDTAHVEE